MTRSVLPSLCRRCQTQFLSSVKRNSPNRAFSSAPTAAQELDGFSVFERALRPRSSPRNTTNAQNNPRSPYQPTNDKLETLAQGARNEASTRPSGIVSETEPYHLNVYAHKHNIHITFTEPSRDPIISFSAGSIGLRKAQRSSFDAAYQLSTYTMRKMAEKQWRVGGKGMTGNKMMTLNEPEVRERGIEVVMRGFGPGREAFQKALLGSEGKIIKPLVKKVTDGTRLKFGGTRSPQVRRLG